MEDTLPSKGLNFLPEIEGLQNHYVTGTLAPPKPKVVAVRHQAPTRLPSAGSMGPSTNGYVKPHGCEAAHAQDWSPSRKYWGKYQFDRETWESHGGGSGEYGNAPENRQDEVASTVKYDAWPNC